MLWRQLAEPRQAKNVNAKAFRDFGQTYQIEHWARIQKDAARKKPEISAAEIYKTLIGGTVIGCRSVLETDQKGRSMAFKSLVGSDRYMIASDTTIMKALSGWDLDAARMANYAARKRTCQEGLGHVRLSSGRSINLAVVDGHNAGGHWMSTLGFAGGLKFQPVDVEPYEGRGHELFASRAVMMRAAEKLGCGFASHIGYDGLAMNRRDFAYVRKCFGAHLVVKTQEEDTLEIVQISKEAWTKISKSELRKAGVEIIEGIDAMRGVVYEVYAQGGIEWRGLEMPLKLAWVKMKHLKGKLKGQTETFWVITTDESLTAAELREIAHLRWRIENNAFKELNEQTGSKRAYIKDAHAKHALMLIQFLGMTLRQAFEWYLETYEEAWRRLTVRKTKRVLGDVLLFGMPGEAAPATGPP